MDKLREKLRGKRSKILLVIMVLVVGWMAIDYYMELHPKEKSVTVPAVLSPQQEGNREEETSTASSSALEVEEQKEEDTTVHLGFAGDMNLDENSLIMQHMRKKGKGISGVIDKGLIQRMKSLDYMVVNNEFAISDRGEPMAGKAYTFCAPEKNTAILKHLGVDAVSLANNHVYDYGKQAFLDTLRSLKKEGIAYTGAGKNEKEAKKPVYFESKGKTIAIIAATRAEKYILTPEAGQNSPGVFRTYDPADYVKAIRKAKKKADVVIAFVHWGTEYSVTLEDAQKEQGKMYIDAGADVVVGAHTHCMQGVGYYKGKPIFYSLGNFWFNEKTLYTTILQLDIAENGEIRAMMVPCLQSGKETRLLTKGKKKKFLRHINNISTNGRLNSKGEVVQATP